MSIAQHADELVRLVRMAGGVVDEHGNLHAPKGHGVFSGRFIPKLDSGPASSKPNSALGRVLSHGEVKVLRAADTGRLTRWNQPPHYGRLFFDQPAHMRPTGAGGNAIEPDNIVPAELGDMLWVEGLLESAEPSNTFPISERVRLSAKGRDVLDAHRKD